MSANTEYLKINSLRTGALFLAGWWLCCDSKIPKIYNYKRSSSFSAVKSINLYILQNQGTHFYKVKPLEFFSLSRFYYRRQISLKILKTKLLNRLDRGQAWHYIMKTKNLMKKQKKLFWGYLKQYQITDTSSSNSLIIVISYFESTGKKIYFTTSVCFFTKNREKIGKVLFFKVFQPFIRLSTTIQIQ